jgi:hypothetical protein
MRYVTWKLYWKPDEKYGRGPEAKIGEAEGAFFTGPDPHDTIVGYVHSDHDLSGLEDWNVQEITGEQAIALAQQINAGATMSNGFIVFPESNLDE